MLFWWRLSNLLFIIQSRCQITMASYTIEQHVQMINLYYQNQCSLVQMLRALRPFYGTRGGPSKSTLKRLVAKFEMTGSVKNQPTPVRQRTARSVRTLPRPVKVCRRTRAVNSSPCTSTRPFADFKLANFASRLGHTPVQCPTDPGAQR